MGLPSMRATTIALSLLGGLAASVGQPGEAVAQERPLRLVLNVGLQTLDPIAGPSFVTRNFAYMVFDTLIAMDGQGRYRPQMLQGWTVSPDGLTYTFTLRPGLVFSDGAPVTPEDCIASLKRWGGRDGLGRRLIGATKEMRATGPAVFELELARPFSQVIEALGKPSVQVPFIMPARIASATPPTTPVKEIVGSGPFLFVKEEWLPGERATFRRNPNYRPRDEPADGLAGGKNVKVERAEIITMPDLATRAAALQANEVDYLEYLPLDYVAEFRRNRNITLAKVGGPAEMVAALTVNHVQPPFDNVKVRQAAAAAMVRTEVLDGLGLQPGAADPACASLFVCGTPFASAAGTGAVGGGIDKARELLKASGYRNERVVFLLPGDSALLNPIGQVMADQLKRAGFNLDVQTQDWSSIAQRWITRKPQNEGGWALVPVVYPGFDMINPLGNPGTGYNCTGGAPYTYCSEALAAELMRFEAERDEGKRKAVAAAMQETALADGTYLVAGQFPSPAAWRSELKGVIDFGLPILWNISR